MHTNINCFPKDNLINWYRVLGSNLKNCKSGKLEAISLVNAKP